MSWVSLGDALETALAKALEDGDAGVGAPAVSRKRTDRTNRPAKYTGQRRTKGETVGDTANRDVEERPAPSDMDRGMLVAAKAGRPTPATGIPMFMVIEGGRKTGEGTRLPAYAQAQPG